MSSTISIAAERSIAEGRRRLARQSLRNSTGWITTTHDLAFPSSVAPAVTVAQSQDSAGHTVLTVNLINTSQIALAAVLAELISSTNSRPNVPWPPVQQLRRTRARPNLRPFDSSV